MKINSAIRNLKNHYKQPTPWQCRKFGDALLAACTFVTTSAIIGNYHKLAIGALTVGALGKFISNFFIDEPENKK
jgi:hypothetical protein